MEDQKQEEITQAFCKIMFRISYSSAEPNNGPDDDSVLDCDGPYLKPDKKNA
jgi:hypothetical protein